MTIDQLKSFLMVANNLNFSQSAEKLYLSQSSLSKYIQSLERELSVKLFDRNTRTIKLTDAGKYLMLHAANIVEEYERMRAGINAYRQEYSHSLTISAIPVNAPYGIASMIASYSMENPSVEIKFSEKDPKLVMDELDTMKIDVGVIRGQHVEASHYKLYPLIDDELVLVTNRAHRFAERTVIDLAEASTEQFVFLYESTFMFKTCLKVCEEAGFFPNYRKLDIGLRTIQSFVAQGMGVSLLMKGTVADAPDSDLCIVALKQKPILTLSLVVRNSVVSPAVKDFVQFALKYFSSHTPSSLETSSASGEQPVRQLF